MSTLLKKVFLSLIAFFVFFSSTASSFVLAQGTGVEGTEGSAGALPDDTDRTWYNPGPLEFYQKVFDQNESEIFGERYTYAQVTWIGYSLLALLMGGDLRAAISALDETENPTESTSFNETNFQVGGISGAMAGIIQSIYNSPPASGIYWLSQKVEEFSIVKTANAQEFEDGFGRSALEIFLPLWRASRNIAYTLMVVIVVAIAFAIMFRVKISPQLIVSIQSSLPQIAVTLVLITFSYAIAGFMIDLMYLVFGFLVYAIQAAGGLSADSGLTGQILFDNFKDGNILKMPFNFGTTTIFIALILLVVASGGALLPFFLGLLVAVVIFFVKAFLMLAQTYISLIINIVFGPIIILSEAIPFIKASALGWFKSLVADILVFFAVGLLFLVQSLLDSVFVDASIGWSPPYLSFSPGLFRVLVWVGVWGMIPGIRKAVYEMMEKRAGDVQVPGEFRGVGEEFSRGMSKYREAHPFGDTRIGQTVNALVKRFAP